MKKILFLFVFMFPVFTFSQNRKIRLHLTEYGQYLTEDNKDYSIIEYPDMSAHDIYGALKTKVIKVFEDPDLIMQTVDDKAIVLTFHYPVMKTHFWVEKEKVKMNIGKALLAVATSGLSIGLEALSRLGVDRNEDFFGTVKIAIDIKDGKIRISTPSIDSQPYFTGERKNADVADDVVKYMNSFDFFERVKTNYSKAEAKREKYKKRAEEINESRKNNIIESEENMSYIMNGLLDFSKDSNDDW